jgi:hypothetical protein
LLFFFFIEIMELLCCFFFKFWCWIKHAPENFIMTTCIRL